MPFDGSGNYIPAAAPNFPAVSGQPVASAYYNAVINDLSSALSNCLTRDGQGKPSAAISWNGQNLSGVNAFSCTGAATVGSLVCTAGATFGGAVSVTGNITATNLSGTNTGDQVITLTGAVTGSGTGSFVTTIAAASITLSQMANMATGSLFYRKTAGAGPPEVNTLATLKADLGLTGTNSGDQIITLTGDVTGTGTGSFATTIAAGAITLAKQANVNSSTVFYRKTAGAGPPEVQTFATLRADIVLPSGQNIGSAATVTPTFNDDQVIVTAQAAAVTFANPTGTPVDGWGITIRMKDSGVAQTITFGTQYRVVGTVLPTTTVANKTLYIGIIYNAADTKWDVVAVQQEA